MDGQRLSLFDLTNSDAVFYYINDHLGTAQILLNNQGVVVWQGNYRPFGQVEVVINNLANRFRFPGQIFDQESGLHYNWNRYYNSEVGRYISADPIELDGGLNLYVYVDNDPVNLGDKEGLRSWKCRRPIGGLPGEKIFPGYNHTYLCATDADKGGHKVCGSTTPANGSIPIIGGYGRPSNYPNGQYANEGDYYHPAACQEIFMPPSDDVWEYTSQDEFDRCIVKNITKRTRPRFAICLWGTDCHEWTDDSINQCFFSAYKDGYKLRWGIMTNNKHKKEIQMESFKNYKFNPFK